MQGIIPRVLDTLTTNPQAPKPEDGWRRFDKYDAKIKWRYTWQVLQLY